MAEAVNYSQSKCSNTGCNARMGCERANNIEDQKIVSFDLNPDGTCDWFIMRSKIVAASQELRVLGRGRRHNLHAPNDKSYRHNGPNALNHLGMSRAQRAKAAGLTPPDLKVARHIRNGKDINKPNENEGD